jgi:hypothetical protein
MIRRNYKMRGCRTLKRVPLDFNWPLGQVWEGYLRPNNAPKYWRPTEPPSGEGYQLWEIVSEGSPVSPVFALPEELAQWCAKNATLFAKFKLGKVAWRKLFLKPGSLEKASLIVLTPEGELLPAITTSKKNPAKK